METTISGANHAVLHEKNTDVGWDPYRLVILVLRTLFCMHKSAGEVWDPYRLFKSVGRHAALHAQIHG